MNGMQEDRQTPVVRVRTPEGTAEVLRAHLARHNQRVLLLAGGTLVAALAAWMLLYFIVLWIVVLMLSVAEVSVPGVLRHFWVVYCTAALCAIIYAWIDQRFSGDARPRDNKRVFEVIIELLLAVPNMTLSVGHTLSALQFLTPEQRLQAAELLHRLGRERRVPVSGVRLQIPDPDGAVRVLFALQITQVIDTFREDNEFWLRLSSLRPGELRMGESNQ
jgi:hypothetical protein